LPVSRATNRAAALKTSLAAVGRAPARTSGAVIVSSSSRAPVRVATRPAISSAPKGLGGQQGAVDEAAQVGGGEAVEQEADEGARARRVHAGRADQGAQGGAALVREDQDAGADVEQDDRADRGVVELGGGLGPLVERLEGVLHGRIEAVVGGAAGVVQLGEQQVDLDLLQGDAVDALVGGAGVAGRQGAADVEARGDGAGRGGLADVLQDDLGGEVVAEGGQAAGEQAGEGGAVGLGVEVAGLEDR
jgi:hypothetical protein